MKVNFITISANKISLQSFWQNTLSSVTVPLRGQGTGQSLLWHVLLASSNSAPFLPLTPKPTLSLNTAVENNSIRHIFIDNLNKSNINNITEILENRRRENHQEVPWP